MDKVLESIAKYVRTHSDIPTPADIMNIINPPKEKLSAAVYVALKKRVADGEYLFGSDKAYLRAFEEQEMAKIRGGSEEWREAQREIESYTQSREVAFYE